MATAGYWRHFNWYEDEFVSVDAAIRFLASGEGSGSLSSEYVRDGVRVIEGEELFELVWMEPSASDMGEG